MARLVVVRRGMRSRVYKRDARGRFTDTPDFVQPPGRARVTQRNVEAARSALSALPSRGRARVTQGLGEARRALDTLEPRVSPRQYSAIAQALAALPPREQRVTVQRLSKVASAPPRAPEGGVVTDGKAKKQKAKSRKRPHVRSVVPEDALTVNRDRVEVWRGPYRETYGSYKGGFKAQTVKNYRYTVKDAQGNDVIYNAQRNRYTFEGEVVNGVPSLINPRRLSNDELFNRLTDTATKVVNSDDRGIPAGAPFWSVRDHGRIKALDNVGTGRAYGQMHIHHIDQWARANFRELNDRFDRGDISKDELIRQYREDLLVKQRDARGKNKDAEVWRIRVADKGDRELVVLPERAHIGRAYDDNHPKGYNPDTGKLEKLGIPVNGDGGRTWFNGWRDRFWGEVWRKETYVIQAEINRRIAKGDLTPTEALELWRGAHRRRVQYIESENRKALKALEEP